VSRLIDLEVESLGGTRSDALERLILRGSISERALSAKREEAMSDSKVALLLDAFLSHAGQVKKPKK
jgi:3'-phosphoadenosine 5'-phosphosulfate sulfotransferase